MPDLDRNVTPGNRIIISVHLLDRGEGTKSFQASWSPVRDSPLLMGVQTSSVVIVPTVQRLLLIFTGSLPVVHLSGSSLLL